jgi:hypothetical protein
MHCQLPVRGSILNSGSVCFVNYTKRLSRIATFKFPLLVSVTATRRLMVPMKFRKHWEHHRNGIQ